MSTTNDNANETTKVKTNKTFVSKETGQKVTVDVLADIKNKSAMLKSNSGRKNSYDYAKVAKNLNDLNEIMNLRLSSDEIKQVQNNIKEFCDEKTKMSYAKNKLFSQIKKDVRKFVQNFQKSDCPYSINEQAIIKTLCQ